MNTIALLKSEQNSVEFYTVEATGNSGISQSGLAKLNGVSHTTIGRLEETLVRSEASEWLEPLADKALTLVRDTDQLLVDGKNAGNLKIYNAAFSVAVIKHYADKGNKEAVYSLMKFAEMGFDAWVQTVTGWSDRTQPQQSDQPPNADRSLVGEINTLYAQLEAEQERVKRDHLQLAKQIGDRLLALKATLKHGQWEQFRLLYIINPRTGLPMPTSTATLFQRISKHWDALQAAKVETVRDAQRLLRRYVSTSQPKLLPPAPVLAEPTFDHPLIHLTLNLIKAGCHPDIAVKEAASVLVNEERITIRTEDR